MTGKRSPQNPPKIRPIIFDGPYPAYSETADVLAGCKHRKSAGVYFWAIRVKNAYRLTHVGQTGTSFYQRMKEYIINTLGGNYRICDPDRLSQGEARPVWDGLWREGTRARLPEFLRDGPRLFELAKRNLQLERIFVAPLKVEDRLRRRIEGAIAQAIRRDAAASSLLPTDIRVLGRLTIEAPLSVRLRTKVKILGLPEQLEI